MKSFKRMLDIFLSSPGKARGMSMVEVVVAGGITSLVVLGVMNIATKSQEQTSTVTKSLKVDDYIRNLRNYMADKAQCESLIGASEGNLTIDLSSFDYELPSNISLGSTTIIKPELSSGVEVLPTPILLYFKTKTSSDNEKSIVRRITAPLEFKDGDYVGCSNYQVESQKSAFKLICEMMGGAYQEDTSGDDSCDYTNINPSSILALRTKQVICENFFGGSYNSSTRKCDSFNMNTLATGSNITIASFLLGSGNVSSYGQLCSGQNNFISGVNSNGTVKCKEVKFCTKGKPGCP